MAPCRRARADDRPVDILAARNAIDGSRRPVRLPYRGWKCWHAVFGLIVGMGALTWAFSGMLSMDPFPLPGDPPHDRRC